MDEFALTSLCLTPSRLTWDQFHDLVVDYFTKDKPGYADISGVISILGTDGLRIARVMTFDRALAAVREDKTLQYWRRLSVDTYVAGVTTTISFMFTRSRDGTSQIEVRFPSKVYVAIAGKYSSEGHFSEEAKLALVTLMVDLASKFGATGFGYGLADEDKLLGAADEAILRAYVEKGIRWFGLPQRYIIAGLRASAVDPADVELDPEDRPLRYAVGDYYLFDRLWPD